MERMKGVAFEAMLSEMSSLMKQYLAREYKPWTPKNWIKEHARYEVGLPSSDEEAEEDEEVAPRNEESGEAMRDNFIAKKELVITDEAPQGVEVKIMETGIGSGLKEEQTTETEVDPAADTQDALAVDSPIFKRN